MERAKPANLSRQEVALFGATRAMGGAGIALLLANRLSEGQRKAVGWTLFLIGAISTIPLAKDIFSKVR